MSITRSLAPALALTLAPVTVAIATEAPAPVTSVEASTPEQHLAVAQDYRAKAAAERKEADMHRKMGRAYLGSKALYNEQMRQHCDKLAALHERLAGEYEALAAAHEKRAKK